MTDAKPAFSESEFGFSAFDTHSVDVIAETLSALKSTDAVDGPSLAEVLRLVRLMENQPEQATERLRAALARFQSMPTPEKVRRDSLMRLGQSEAALARLPAAERDRIENEVAADIRRHFGIGFLPAPRHSRPVFSTRIG